LAATEIDSEGRVRQLADIQEPTYGEQDGRSTPRLREPDDTRRGAGFGAALSGNITQDMWQNRERVGKPGSYTCLMRGNIGEFAAVPGGVALPLSALRDSSGIAGPWAIRLRTAPILPAALVSLEDSNSGSGKADLLRSAAAALFLGSLASLAAFFPALLPVALGRGERGDRRRQNDAQQAKTKKSANFVHSNPSAYLQPSLQQGLAWMQEAEMSNA
jgi:hypothetical protein